MTRSHKNAPIPKTARLLLPGRFAPLAARTRHALPFVFLTLAVIILFSPSCKDRPQASGEAPGSAPGSATSSAAAASAGSNPASPPLSAEFPSGKPYFVRVPPPEDWRRLSKPPLTFDKARKWGPAYELRHTDLSRLDLTAHGQDLLNVYFDTETNWPAALPAGFDPAKILELNRNPGLGIRELHARGVTGKGVSVAVVDTPILLDHVEYADRLRFYGEANVLGKSANFHGALVTSILAGRTCGVAPEAELYYVGSHNYEVDSDEGSGGPNATHYAKAVEELIEVNARLPREQRIRVISISAGCGPENIGYKAMNKAVRKAAKAGIFVVAGNIAVDYEPGFWFWGLYRASMDDPDDPSAYRAFSWKEWVSQVAGRDGFEKFYEKRLKRAGTGAGEGPGAGAPEFLLVPEGPKTVAGAAERDGYGFYQMGGWSSVLPYIAGLYALACQVKPDITPEGFWRAALATGDPMPVKADWATYAGKVVNPARLIESLR